MRQVRAITSVALCWALVVSTLFAGSPHVDCRCPDGRIKQFCLSIFFQTTCCVEDSCCTAQEQQTPQKSCCGGSFHQILPGLSATSGQVRSEGCSKSLVGAQVYHLSELPRNLGCELTPHSLALTPTTLLLVESPCAETRLLALSIHRPPPSDDLIIVLQHFLI